MLYSEYKWIEAVHRYACIVGGILYLVVAGHCVAAPAIDENAQIPTFLGVGVMDGMVMAKAVVAPPGETVGRARKECLAVSMYEEPVKTGQTDKPSVRIAFSFTFSQEYPVMLCGILPLNTAEFSTPGT